MARRPFDAGSVSLGLAAREATARSITAQLIDDARVAFVNGFDGVTLSEHHAGFPGYVPNPLLLAGVLLGATDGGWACPGPSILPLRRPVLVAEDLAWLDAAFPDRVGAGFVPGYQQDDFTAAGVDFEPRRAAFWTALDTVVTALGAGTSPSPIQRDAAVRELATRGLPLLAGVSGRVGARKAAHSRVGLLLSSLRSPEEAGRLVRAYRDAGGGRPVVLIRRVHVGGVAAGFAPSMAQWTSRSGSAPWLAPADEALIAGSPDAVASALIAHVERSGCTALNLRLDAYTGDTDDGAAVADQIAMLGRDVLPAVRDALGW